MNVFANDDDPTPLTWGWLALWVVVSSLVWVGIGYALWEATS
jgi:hypothetical protein